MKILIIEDNAFKKKDIEKCISSHFAGALINGASAYSSGLRRAYNTEYDFVILDNGLPYYESTPMDIQPDMAQYILEELLELEICPKCIICSAFDPGTKEEYFDKLVRGFEFCIGYVRYDSTDSSWESILVKLIREATEKA